jgi:hypothetical protein
MATIYIHIGAHKTGSSAVQMALHRSRDRLRAKGILYPGPAANHAELYLAFCDHPHLEHKNLRRGINTKEAAKRWNDNTLAQYRRALEQKGISTVLLSAEGLSRLSEDGVRRLEAFVGEFCDNPVIVSFVRSPVAFTTSYAQVAIFEGRCMEEIEKLPPVPHYMLTIGNFLKVFGKNRMRVLNYDDINAKGEPLVASLLRAMDVDSEFASTIREDRVNVSMNWEAALVFAAINKRYPPFIGNRRNLERANIPRSWLHSIGSRRFAMPPQWRKEVYRNTRADVSWLREEFGIEFQNEDNGEGLDSQLPEAVFDRKVADDLAVLLHQNAVLIEASIREILSLKSRLAEQEGDNTQAARLLEQSISLDPYQPEIAERLARLNHARSNGLHS